MLSYLGYGALKQCLGLLGKSGVDTTLKSSFLYSTHNGQPCRSYRWSNIDLIVPSSLLDDGSDDTYLQMEMGFALDNLILRDIWYNSVENEYHDEIVHILGFCNILFNFEAEVIYPDEDLICLNGLGFDVL